jgi:hypothetical protein
MKRRAWSNRVNDTLQCIANEAWALARRKGQPHRSDARSTLAGTPRARLKAVSKDR